MKYFLTGASGFLGTHLVRLLTAKGHRVTALVYEPEREAVVRALGAATVVGGFDPDLLREAMTGHDGVFHVAGFVSLADRAGRVSRAVNVDGVRTVLAAALAAGVRRVVHTASLVTIGATLDGRVLDETARWDLGRIGMSYVNTKREGELAALAFNARGLEVVVCNPGGLIGPDDLWGSAAGRMFRDYLRGRLRIVPHVRNNWVDVRDVAHGHLLAMQRGRAGERYVLGNANTTLRDLLARLDERSGLGKGPVAVLGWPWTLLLGALLQTFSRASPLNEASARFLRHAFWVSADKAARELGFRPRPIEETLEEALAWHLRNPDGPAA
jgi:dihydroflavonol-4-reductase